MERIMNQIWGFACIILLPRIETEHTNVTVHNPRKINIVSCDKQKLWVYFYDPRQNCWGNFSNVQLNRIQHLNQTTFKSPHPRPNLIESHFCLKTNTNNYCIIQNNIDSKVDGSIFQFLSTSSLQVCSVSGINVTTKTNFDELRKWKSQAWKGIFFYIVHSNLPSSYAWG